MGDNPVSTPVSPQRKLPIPANSANTNSALKGIQIKPKRILPAQPDNQKLKRNALEASPECKADDTANENSRADYNPPCKSENANKNSLHKVTIPKLLIDVDKLKTHFQLQGRATGRAGSWKTDLNENEITKTSENDTSAPLRSQSECGNVTNEFVSRENKLFDYDADRLTKLKEWCSSSEIDNVTANMSAESSVTKSLERNIRSPSPKSNTTWDRSSSGYSSDERADPRSPPPSHSASISVSSKTETELTTDDDVMVSNNGDASEIQTDAETENETDQLSCTNNEVTSETASKTDNESGSNYVVVTRTNSNETNNVIESENEGAQCDNCEAGNNSVDKSETTNSCVSFPFDNAAGAKQNSKRPAWTAHSPLPGNGRILYRKSGSESMISLRHSSRQGMVENNFDGLEVCGKSFPQPPLNNSAKNDTTPSEGAYNEASGRQEILSPTSAFVPVPRIVTSTGNGSESGQIDSTGLEMTARSRIHRQSLPPCRSPRDIKSLGLGSSGTYITRHTVTVSTQLF